MRHPPMLRLRAQGVHSVMCMGRWVSCFKCGTANNIAVRQEWVRCKDCGFHAILEVPDEPEPVEFPEPCPTEMWGEP